MGNQSNSQCSQACCDNQDAEERHTNGTFPDDRKEVMITDNGLPDLAPPPELRGAASLPAASAASARGAPGVSAPRLSAAEAAQAAAERLEAQGIAAAKVFGAVAAEGDGASTTELGLALKRLAERVAGSDRSLQGPAVDLVRKEWQYLEKLGSSKERANFIDLIVRRGLDSSAGRALVAGLKKTLRTQTATPSTTPAGSTLTPLSSSGRTPLSNDHADWLDTVPTPSSSEALRSPANAPAQGPAPPRLD